MNSIVMWKALKSAAMANALFTIEQVELIRRLRSSGITKDQVIMAFEQLDRLEGELGKSEHSSKLLVQNNNNCSQNYESSFNETSINSSPTSIGINKCTHLPNSTNSCQLSNGILNTLRTDLTSPMQSSFKIGDQSGSQSFSRPHSNGTSSSEGVSDSNNGNISPVANPSITSPTSKLPTDLSVIPVTATSARQGNDCLMYNREGSSGIPVQCMINPHDLLQEECYELEELKKKDDSEILAEIRNFVMRYNIKQTMIAEMTKMSQAYVSRFFRGDIQDMSERTKNTFYIWYLTCKHNPWKLAQLCPNSGLRKMMSDTGDLIPMKRERFTFKAPHLAVLERYYEKDPYPDTVTREQIVEECNKAVIRQDRPLSERERVTLPVVNNWFNNRRKEAKKQLRQHHAAVLAAAAAVMKPMTQPSTSLSSSIPATSWALPTSQMPLSLPSVQSTSSLHSQFDLTSDEVESESSQDSSEQFSGADLMTIDFDEGKDIKPEI